MTQAAQGHGVGWAWDRAEDGTGEQVAGKAATTAPGLARDPEQNFGGRGQTAMGNKSEVGGHGLAFCVTLPTCVNTNNTDQNNVPFERAGTGGRYRIHADLRAASGAPSGNDHKLRIVFLATIITGNPLRVARGLPPPSMIVERRVADR
jgi:hypothetical protein